MKESELLCVVRSSVSAALVAFNPEHKKYTLLKSAFELSHIKDWLESVRMGGVAAAPLHVRRAGGDARGGSARCGWLQRGRVGGGVCTGSREVDA